MPEKMEEREHDTEQSIRAENHIVKESMCAAS